MIKAATITMSDLVGYTNFTSLIQTIRRSHPEIGMLLNYNTRGTMQLLINFNAVLMKEKGDLNGIHTFRGNANMEIRKSGSDRNKTWAEYKVLIHKYISDMCESNEMLNQYKDALNSAIKTLADHLWREYSKKYPYWPGFWNSDNRGDIYLNISGSYYYDGNCVVHWNCTGFVTVEDRRTGLFATYHASITGSPELKVVILDQSLLNKLQRLIRYEGIDAAKMKVDRMTCIDRSTAANILKFFN